MPGIPKPAPAILKPLASAQSLSKKTALKILFKTPSVGSEAPEEIRERCKILPLPFTTALFRSVPPKSTARLTDFAEKVAIARRRRDDCRPPPREKRSAR